MSDDESQHDPLQTEGGEISAANGSREVENALPPLGSEETGENDESVAARIRLRRQRQQAADADILDPLQTGGGEISVANGSDTVEVDQSGLPSWARQGASNRVPAYPNEPQSAHGCVLSGLVVRHGSYSGSAVLYPRPGPGIEAG
jgi:hypothetical protein